MVSNFGMFELASLNDLIALKQRHIDKLYPEEHQWGLKQFGTLFCYERLQGISGRFLEVGVGQNRFFDANLPASIDYWGIDKSGFYDEKAFRHSASLRTRMTYVDGLLGDNSPDLPASSFDAVFSISVLEHTPVANINAACRDMHRVLKPGGIAIHTLDLTSGHYETIGKAYLRELQEAGFAFERDPRVDYRLMAEEGLLTEPAAIVFKYYSGRREHPWENPPAINQHTATVKIVARK